VTAQVVSAADRTSLGGSTRFGARTIATLQIVLTGAVFVAFWPTTGGLVLEWENTENTTYTHGYLVLGIFAWLLFRNRDRLRDCTVKPAPGGVLLLALLGFAWLVSLRSGLQTVHQMLLPFLGWSTIFAAFGAQIAVRSALPFAYLYFAIPIWGAINGVLQQATVFAVDILLRLSGIPAFVEGNIVELAAGTFEVAGGCSGMHFFIVALALAVLYGEVNRDSLKVRVQLVLLASALALVANWVRVYSIILAGYLTDMQHYLITVDHYRFGWIVFAGCMTIFFLLARRLPTSLRREIPDESAAVADIGTLARGAAYAVAGFSLAPIWNFVSPTAAAADFESVVLLPSKLNGWSGPQLEQGDGWRPVFVGADRSQMGSYRNVHRGTIVEMFAAVYAQQAQGKELVGYGNSIAGADHDGLQRERVDVGWDAVELKAFSDGRPWLIWYYYDIDGVRTATDRFAQIYYGLASLRSDPLSSVIALRTICASDCAAERQHLKDFVSMLEASGPARESAGGSPQ
jgi:exosortase A